MAKIFHAARCRGDFARRDYLGKRGLHRLRRWESPSSRISKRTAAAEKIRTRALASFKRCSVKSINRRSHRIPIYIFPARFNSSTLHEFMATALDRAERSVEEQSVAL